MSQKRFSTKISIRFLLAMIASLGLVHRCENDLMAGDWLSGTYLDPAKQREDLLPHPIWNSLPEYRAVYNRPRFIGGYLAYKIEPTSQEAMAWKANYCDGNYCNHKGRVVPLYYYPKPWEAINTRPRPDYVPTEQ